MTHLNKRVKYTKEKILGLGPFKNNTYKLFANFPRGKLSQARKIDTEL